MKNEETAGQLRAIFLKDELLNRKFDEVKVLWHTAFEIMPSLFFDPGMLEDDTAYNRCKMQDAVIVFEVPAEITSVINASFEKIKSFHSAAVLIDAFSGYGGTGTAQLFVQVNAATLEVLAFDDNRKLRLYNAYDYHSVNDFMYFVLLVADSLKTDREAAEIIFSGEIEKGSAIHEKCRQFFSKTSFVSLETLTGDGFQDIPQHRNFLLNRLALCE